MFKKFSLVVLIFVFSITAFGQTTDSAKGNSPIQAKAISYGLLVDNSGSMRVNLERIVGAAKTIFEANNPGDQAFLVRFVDAGKIQLVQDFTASIDELDSATDELFIEGGQTAILDALDFGAKHFEEKEDLAADGKKVLILISDGDEAKSAIKLENLLKFLKEKKIKVYTFGIADGKIYRNLLEKLAKETGGKSFIVEKPADFKNLLQELTIAVRTQ